MGLMKRKHRHGLLYRTVLSFCSITVLASVLLTVIIFTAMNSANQEAIQSLMSDAVQMSCDYMERSCKAPAKLCDNLTRNVNLQEYLQMEFQDLPEQFSTDLSGSSELMSMVGWDSCVNGIYVLGENGGIYKSNILSLSDSDYRQTHWYRQIITQSQPVWFYSDEGSLMVKTASTQEEYLYVGYPFQDKTTGRNIGVVLAEISSTRLLGAMSDDLEQICRISLYDLSADSPMPIANGNPDLTALLNEQKERFPQSDYGYVQFVSQEQDILLSMSISPSPWTIIGHIRASDIRPYTTGTLVLLILAVLTIIFIAILVAISLSRSIVSPIQRLAESMEAVENGDFSISVPVERPDEIGQLSNSFNHLIGKIRSLIDQVYRDQEKLRMAELSTMQAQINPHFLYNSLDSTIWLLKTGQVSRALEMLQALSTLFRVALSKGRSTIPLSRELQHVGSYLRIQHLRYSQKFDYTISAQEDILDCEIVKVVIQPLVENAIYHGIREAQKIHIEIRVWAEEDTIFIRVRDDGIGIPEEELAALREQMEHPYDLPAQGYGLHNANARLKICYGKAYGLDIRSVLGHGTDVTIRLPKRKGTVKEYV